MRLYRRMFKVIDLIAGESVLWIPLCYCDSMLCMRPYPYRYYALRHVARHLLCTWLTNKLYMLLFTLNSKSSSINVVAGTYRKFPILWYIELWTSRNVHCKSRRNDHERIYLIYMVYLSNERL